MSLFNSYDRTSQLAELGVPYDIGSGAVTPATQRQNILRNIFGSTTITVAQVAVLDGVVPGTVTASKALVVDVNKDLASLRNLTLTGTLTASIITASGAVTVNNTLTTTDGVASGTARKVGGIVLNGVAAADVVTAVTSNGAFVSHATTYAMPANSMKAGSVLKGRAVISVNDATGVLTLSTQVRLGGTVVAVTTAVDPGAVTDHHIIDFEITARAAPGAASSLIFTGQWLTNTGGTMASGSQFTIGNLATNGALTLDVQTKWSATGASTSARLEQFDATLTA